MASKRKKRRQAARKEAQRKIRQMAPVDNSQQNQPSKKYKEYRVASQLDPKAAIIILTVKEWDEDALMAFICRIYEVPSVDKFSFLEVHEIVEGGVRIVRDGGDWPKGSPLINKPGFVVRGKDRALEVRSTGSKVIGNAKPATVAQTTSTIVTGGFVEERLPVKRYKTKYMVING